MALTDLVSNKLKLAEWKKDNNNWIKTKYGLFEKVLKVTQWKQWCFSFIYEKFMFQQEVKK